MGPPTQQAGDAQQPALTAAAFGLSLSFDVPPPGAWETRGAPSSSEPRLPSLAVRTVTAQSLADSWSGFAEIGWEGLIDGAPFLVERGIAGDHRFVHGAHPEQGGAPAAGTRAVHHLSADASVLRCAPTDPGDPSWWRVVLDSVLFTVALLQGYEALHAGAVATPDGVIAITAASGGGKSTLLSELLTRGLPLMADDVLVLGSRGTGPPISYPAPPLMTVPTSRIPMLGATDPLEPICSLADELWIAVPIHPEPLALKALVVLDRQPGLDLLLDKIDDQLAPLLGSLMSFPSSPERQRARFELAGTLASKTALWRLSADMDTSPGVLADTLLATLNEP
jgi:hypothetical protein